MRQTGTALLMYVQDYDESYPINLYLGDNNSCLFTGFTAVMPYQKNTQINLCPSDSHPLDWTIAFSIIGLPPPCASSPNIVKTSYQWNYALIDNGDPNPLFGGGPGRPVKTLAEIEFPADTSAISDATVTLPTPPGTANFGLFDSPVQTRHTGTVNAAYADGHAKAVHTKPAKDVNGNQLDGYQLDGFHILDYIVTDGGPYEGRDELWGVPYKNADGTWGLHD